MSDLIWLPEAQTFPIGQYFCLSHGVSLADERLVISGMIFLVRNGLLSRDAPKNYGPHETNCNRFIR